MLVLAAELELDVAHGRLADGYYIVVLFKPLEQINGQESVI